MNRQRVPILPEPLAYDLLAVDKAGRQPDKANCVRTKRCIVAIKPVVQALLLADQVYTDVTGKKVIAGTYDCVFCTGFPAEFARETYAYICLSNIRRMTTMQLKYVDLSTDEILMEYGPINIHSPDPLANVDFVVPVPPLFMPHPGIYAFELFTGNDMIGCIRLSVESLHDEDEDEEGNEHGGDEEDDYS
jgi:hypothetical protein